MNKHTFTQLIELKQRRANELARGSTRNCPLTVRYISPYATARHNASRALTRLHVNTTKHDFPLCSPPFSSYLLTADAPAADPTPFPDFPNGDVGVLREAAEEHHFEAVSHPQAFFEASPSGELGMTFKADSCEITTELVLQTMDTHQVVQDHVMLMQDSSGEISLNARFPEPGL